MENLFDLIIIGGGAAGIFAAIAAKENTPSSTIAVLEKTGVLLSKVKVSGGGRCNVTHACFDPFQLVNNYPRGHKELIGPFHHFQPKNMIEWLENHGVELKTEPDGRMFPTTDSSITIIDCLLKQAKNLKIEIYLKQKIDSIVKQPTGYLISCTSGSMFMAKKILLATGSSPEGHTWAKELGHTIQEPVPSLFTFNIPHFSLHHLSGISINPVEIKIFKLSQLGPLLITHFGFSGPAVLKLSAWGARQLHACNYTTLTSINWLPHNSEDDLFHALKDEKIKNGQKMLSILNPFRLPKNLWKCFIEELADQKCMTIPDKRLRKLAQKLHCDTYQIEGKTTNKEEFVTCGGISLNEIDFKTMESKVSPGLFFAGEILDIDGVTGGFNFQNAWTTGFIAGSHAC